MLARNQGNATLCKQIQASLDVAEGDLVAARSEALRMQRSITGKEAEKKFWAKF